MNSQAYLHEQYYLKKGNNFNTFQNLICILLNKKMQKTKKSRKTNNFDIKMVFTGNILYANVKY